MVPGAPGEGARPRRPTGLRRRVPEAGRAPGARPVVPEGRFPHRSRRITSAPQTADTLPAQPVTAFRPARQARDQRRHGAVHHTKAPPRRGLSRSGARRPRTGTRPARPLRPTAPRRRRADPPSRRDRGRRRRHPAPARTSVPPSPDPPAASRPVRKPRALHRNRRRIAPARQTGDLRQQRPTR